MQLQRDCWRACSSKLLVYAQHAPLCRYAFLGYILPTVQGFCTGRVHENSSAQFRACTSCASKIICLRLQAGSGPSLAAELHKLAEQIVSAATAFIEGAFLGQRSHDDVNRLAGMVFERCNAAKKAPLDNKTAIGRGLVQVRPSRLNSHRGSLHVRTLPQPVGPSLTCFKTMMQ